LAVTPRAFKFTKIIFEFPLINARKFLTPQSTNNQPLDDKVKVGFSKFLKYLKLYQEHYDISIANDDKVTIYGSVTLENGAIMRANSNFHGKPWFSNVSIHMNSEELFNYQSDEGICYGQVII
jgi:hypothetical protein